MSQFTPTSRRVRIHQHRHSQSHPTVLVPSTRGGFGCLLCCRVSPQVSHLPVDSQARLEGRGSFHWLDSTREATRTTMAAIFCHHIHRVLLLSSCPQV